MSGGDIARKARPLLLAVASGVAGFLGYVGFDHFYLQWIFLALLLLAVRGLTPRRAFLVGWLGGTVGHMGGFYWIVHMMMTFANLNLALGIVSLVGIAAINAVSFGLFTWAVQRINGETGWSVAWVAPVAWIGIAHFFPYIFPFYLAASQYRLTALTQIADITGVLGVSFMLVWCNGVVYELAVHKLEHRPFPRRQLTIFAVVLALVLGYGALRIKQIDSAAAEAPKITAALIQTNLGAADKHSDRVGFLRQHHKMSAEIIAARQIDLLVWPEGAYNAYLRREDEELSPRVLGPVTTPIIFGALTVGKQDGKRKRYNTALAADTSRVIQGRYDKRILVPFGEYIPLGDTFPIIYKWSPYSGRYWPGESLEPLTVGGYTYSVNICYEDLFPGLVRDLFNGASDPKADLPHALVNITNDSWYGDTVQPMEHLVLASFRAIELRRPMLRSTNTGVSALIDPVGRLAKRSGQWTREVIVGDVPMMSGRSLFAILGNWFGWLVFAVLLYALGQSLWLKRQRKPARDPRSQPPAKKRRSKKR